MRCSTTTRASRRASPGRRPRRFRWRSRPACASSTSSVAWARGRRSVVNGAAGGVGVAAAQIARARGAHVIGTASERNHEFLRSLGAEPITYGDGMVERVRALAPDGVDLAFDTAGKGGIPDLITLTGDPARVATIADFGAAAVGVKVTGGAEGPRPGRPRRSGPPRGRRAAARAGPADVHLRRRARRAPPERGRPRPRQARPGTRLSGVPSRARCWPSPAVYRDGDALPSPSDAGARA